jgi:hypothetical protein
MDQPSQSEKPKGSGVPLPAVAVVPRAATWAGWRLASFEVAWIVLVFFLFAASPPPDVGESHYLVKAKHYWQPDWCAGDLFLESHDAHQVFYWTFGWVTRFCSLPATAWIGRLLTWSLLAWSWRRLSWAVAPRPLWSLLSAGLMLLFLRNFHLAGEWVVGGVEAKGFAYVLVFLALEAIVRGRWSVALLFAGGAGAFHVLVGGWTVVALGIAWLISWRERPPLLALVPAAIGGAVLALPGLIPAIALSRGVPAELSQEAARIYVFGRLSHHLVYHELAPSFILRFQLLLVGWGAVVWCCRQQANIWRLQAVVAGAVVIGLVGVAIDQLQVYRALASDQSPLEYQLSAASILRYYWFRMSDSLVPIGTALAIVSALHVLAARRPPIASGLLVVAILGAGLNVADIVYWRRQQRLPPAILQPRPTPDSQPRSWLAPMPPPSIAASETTAEAWAKDWQAVCAWVAANTPARAVFITPREQQTFKWYAGRAEIANWKDVPQDAAGIVEWKRRIDELYPSDKEHHRYDLAAFSDDELRQLARTYAAEYIIVDATRANRRIGLTAVYPTDAETNRSFAVYQVRQAGRP